MALLVEDYELRSHRERGSVWAGLSWITDGTITRPQLADPLQAKARYRYIGAFYSLSTWICGLRQSRQHAAHRCRGRVAEGAGRCESS